MLKRLNRAFISWNRGRNPDFTDLLPGATLDIVNFSQGVHRQAVAQRNWSLITDVNQHGTSHGMFLLENDVSVPPHLPRVKPYKPSHTKESQDILQSLKRKPPPPLPPDQVLSHDQLLQEAQSLLGNPEYNKTEPPSKADMFINKTINKLNKSFREYAYKDDNAADDHDVWKRTDMVELLQDVKLEDKDEPDQFAVFSGRVEDRIVPSKTGPPSRKEGWVTVVSPRWPKDDPLDIDEYCAFELIVRTDGRLYVMNAEGQSYDPLELQQEFFCPPPREWWRVRIPFEDLTTTKAGQEKMLQRDLTTDSVFSFGFSAIGPPGDFRLDIAAVRVVRIRPSGHWADMSLRSFK